MSRRFVVVVATMLLLLAGPALVLAQDVPMTTNALGTPCAQPDATPLATPGNATPASPAAGASPIASAQGTPTAGAGAYTVTMHDIFYEPTQLTIPADTDVVLTLINAGATEHTFSINSLGPGKIGIGPVVLPGQTQEVEINAAAGEYEYYCQVPGHKAAGMVGTLVVN